MKFRFLNSFPIFKRKTFIPYSNPVRHYLFFIIWLIMLLPNHSAWSQSIVNTHTIILETAIDSSIDIKPHTFVYVDKTTNLTIKEIEAEKRAFIPLDSLVYEGKYNRGRYAYWYYFELQNITADTLHPIFYLPRLDVIDLYRKENGHMEHKALGRNNFGDDTQRFLPFPEHSASVLNLPPGKRVKYWVRWRLIPGISKDVRPILFSDRSFLEKIALPFLPFYLLKGLFFGVFLFVLVFTFFQFIQNREQAFLFYSLYIFSLLMYFLRDFDLTDSYLNILPAWAIHNVVYAPAKLFQYAAYVLFVDRFLDARHKFLTLHKVSNYILLIILFFFIIERIIWVNDLWIAWQALSIFRYSFYLISFYYVFVMLRNPSLLGLYVILGTLAVLLSEVVAIIIAHYSGFHTSGLWDVSQFSAYIGIFLQLCSFSLGLGYKQRKTQQEKIALSAELKLKEKEAQHHQEISNVKSTFYTNITHEFRTPLTIIIGMADELSGKAKNLILRNSQKLLNLINQMLELAQLESSKQEINWVQTDVSIVIKSIIEPFLQLAKQKQQHLNYYIAPENIMMDVDVEKLERIISNLLSNAFKFTPEYRHISFIAKQEGQNLHLEVKDTGQGIAEEHLPFIFDRFYQADSSTSRQYEGTGVGLALTKQLIKLLGGSITVESIVNQGSSFHVYLPIHHQAPIEEVPIETSNVHFVHEEESDVEKKSFSRDSKVEENLPQLLIIEDNRDLQIYLQSFLTKSYHIQTARNGKIGLEKAIQLIPDIIICDLMLPEMDGLEICQRLKKHEKTNHIPIIILTAKGTQNDQLEGIKTGADAYLTKPFHKEELRLRLEKLLEKSKSAQAQRGFNTQWLTLEDKDKLFLQKLHETVDNLMGEPSLNIDTLSKELGVSRAQLNRKTKKLTQLTPLSFIKKKRMIQAKKLLTQSKYAISEIAYQLGFTDPSYFTKVYFEEFGRLPSEEQ